jgi:hypothetical protein
MIDALPPDCAIAASGESTVVIDLRALCAVEERLALLDDPADAPNVEALL